MWTTTYAINGCYKVLKSEWQQAIQPKKIATEPGSNQHQVDGRD